MYHAIPQYMSAGNFYKKLAKYYDKIYVEKDYAGEAKFMEWVVKKHQKGKGKKLIDIACGTGNHIQYLKNHYKVTGLDLNPEMLKLARKKVQDVKFIKGDMKKLALDEKFDVIIFNPPYLPIAVLLHPVVELHPDCIPKKVLKDPVVLTLPASHPKKTLQFPVVFSYPAPYPMNTFKLPVVLLRPADVPMKSL